MQARGQDAAFGGRSIPEGVWWGLLRTSYRAKTARGAICQSASWAGSMWLMPQQVRVHLQV